MKKLLLLLFFTTAVTIAQKRHYYPENNEDIYSFDNSAFDISSYYNLNNATGAYDSTEKRPGSTGNSYKITTVDDASENDNQAGWFNINQSKWVQGSRTETVKISMWIKPFTNSVGKKVSIGIGCKDDDKSLSAVYPQTTYTLLAGWNLYETYISVEATTLFGARMVLDKTTFITPDTGENYGVYVDDINIESNTVVNAGFESGKFAGDSQAQGDIWAQWNNDTTLEYVTTESYSGNYSAKITAPNDVWRALSPKDNFLLLRKTYYGGGTTNNFLKSNPLYESNAGGVSETLLGNDIYVRASAMVKAELNNEVWVRVYFNITYTDTNGATQTVNIEDGPSTVLNTNEWVKIDTEDVQVSNAHSSGRLNDMVSIDKIKVLVQSVKQGNSADGSNVTFYVDDVEMNYSTTDPTTLSNNVFSADAFSLYPNPVTDVLNIQGEEVVDSVAIYNVLGQLEKEVQLNAATSQIDVNGLNAGLYVVKVTANGQTKSYKIVKS